MNKEELTGLIQRFPSSTADEAQKVLILRNQYKYCQVLHGLAARAYSDHSLANHAAVLQEAAIHSTDRSVLKEIMTRRIADAEPPTVAIKSSAEATHDFADEVFEDLERLKHSKEIFESMFGTSGLQPVTEKKTEKPKREVLKSKKQRIVEMAKELAAPANPESNVLDKSKTKKESKTRKEKKSAQADPLIEAIKTSHKKIKPENEKTKEQIEIINQFIKAKQVIATQPVAEENPQDMSESVRSGEFTDHIVSETLVEILIKQGKKDKAIEVLKKLIWKFPQKKTYFAARIDDLKK